jgi:flagellin
MTRINTNVGSLVGRNNLAKSNASLSQALNRLSTGLRINTGKDDPSGLIASERLRSDMTSIKRAITNTERAGQFIATADSALGEISNLLNDIRGLVTASANSGILSQEQLDANQVQVDSSLEALNRIAQTTTFQGRRLLDGSLDFLTSAGSNFSSLQELRIDQANLGATGSVSVDVAVNQSASQAQVNVTGIPAAVTPTAASGTMTFAFAGTASSGTLTLASADTISITAANVGDSFDGVDIVINDVNTGNAASYNAGTNTISVDIDITGGDTTATLQGLINGLADFNATTTGSAALQAGDATTFNNVTSGGADAGNDVITVTSDNTGTTANGVTVTLLEAASVGATPTAAFNGSNIEVTVDNTASTTISAIAAAINGLSGYGASVTTSAGSGNYVGATATPPGATTLSGGLASSGGITQDLVFELSGSDGSEVLSFNAGTGIADLVDGINLLQDATGVTATANGTTLELRSNKYGADAVVNVSVISEGAGAVPSGTFAAAIGQGARDTGSDIDATVNGVAARGKGNSLSINTASLDMSVSVAAGFTGTASFTINGGGALFQLGPDVVANQQSRLGITSVNTARLGGISGKLFNLGSGGNASLSVDTTTADRIVNEAISQVTGLRGRLGAFQRTTLETNRASLNETLTNLTEAESSIRDADFAEETAALTRAQILVQSGTAVLQVANQNPQNVLSLLG